MTATRHALLERAAQALTHALDTCAGDDTRATLSKAFSKHKLQTIFDLASFPEDILAKLDYDDEDLIDRSCIPLDLSCHHVIRQLRVYHREHRNKDNTLDIEFWFNVTVESWLEWTMNQANNIPSTITVPVPAPPAPVPVPTDASTVDSSVATEFPPGYKLNMSRYSECILKDPSKLLLWEETFLDKTIGDYLDTIFTKEDTKYKPKSKRRRKRHAQKQRIGFEILSTVIQFAAGKNILRKYRSSNDAQQAYIDIRKEAGGITNELDKASLMDEITSMKIKDSTPDNKVEKIIEDVNTKIQAYDDRQIATAGCKPMEDSFKVGLLNAVIFNHHKLLTAKQSVLSDCARDQKVATYADFYNRYKTEAKIMAHTATTTNREANQRLEINEGNQEDVQGGRNRRNRVRGQGRGGGNNQEASGGGGRGGQGNDRAPPPFPPYIADFTGYTPEQQRNYIENRRRLIDEYYGRQPAAGAGIQQQQQPYQQQQPQQYMMPPASPHTAFQLNGAIQQPYQQAPGSAPASVAGSLAGIHIQAAEQQYVLVPRNMQAHSSNSTIGTTATQHQYPPLIETRRAA